MNKYRGEISASLSGKEYKLSLNLGGLAELESVLDADDLMDLVKKLEKGRFSALQISKILRIGLCCGGHDLTQEEVAGLTTEQGLAGFVDIVNRLLSASFGGSPSSADEETLPGIHDGNSGDIEPRKKS